MTKKIVNYITQEKIQERVESLAKEISQDYKDTPILALCLLKGAMIFCSDLIRCITSPVQIDFMVVSSYGNETVSSGKLDFRYEGKIDVAGKHILVVEDIIDTGTTLHYIKEKLAQRGALSVKLVCLLSKPQRRVHQIPVDYLGFEIADRFVVGYGLDFAENYRQLPYIGELIDT